MSLTLFVCSLYWPHRLKTPLVHTGYIYLLLNALELHSVSSVVRFKVCCDSWVMVFEIDTQSCPILRLIKTSMACEKNSGNW